ncbi:7653_t:CDS:10 [Acaulospora colombiana]|uniref:7653_t:CDS:1 n=1 Tax=Acaulospora colombiana TaxID=27376 RepID=A0ACA9L848_9GLOM|nr:7653_t:CDS:10 [Acaulospora colombiana]
MQNLHQCDNPEFGEFLNDCTELLWRAQNDKPGNKENELLQQMKHMFNSIMDADGIFGVLISKAPGRRCIRRVLFDFNAIKQIEPEKLLKAGDTIVTLVEGCHEHDEISLKLSEELAVYKACTDLLETLQIRQSANKNATNFRKNSLPPDIHEMVLLDNEANETQHPSRKRAFSTSTVDFNNFVFSSIQDKKNLTLLRMEAPKKPSELHNFFRILEQKKIDSLKGLIGFFPCSSCHKRALIGFAPDKYSLPVEETESSVPRRIFRLPFEFDENDKLGPWDILLSEDTIKDMRKLKKSPHLVDAVMKKLGQISSGKWEKYGLQRKASSSNVPDIPVYEVELPEYGGLKILWQVDYGFSIRSYSNMQLVKIWAVTDIKEQIRETLENLAMKINGVVSPRYLNNEESAKSTDKELPSPNIDDEKLVEVHRMLVTNKFVPLSKNLFKSLVFGGFDFTFQVSKVEYDIINNPTSAIVIVSYNLCRRVKDYFYRLRESAVLAEKPIPMDELNEYMRRKEEEDSGIDIADDIMIEEDDENMEFGNIPNSFHLLEDHHFPLFITYNKFSEMLQGTYDIDVRTITKRQNPDENGDDDEHNDEGLNPSCSFINESNASWAHFVDYDLFKKRYWRHFGDNYRNKMDCELVYSEFSVIKGTNPEVEYLSRDEYRAISTRKYPAFCSRRDEIYDLFERYGKMKARNDLRALMHKWEVDHHMYNGIKSQMFELNTNYRSHDGILKLASSVIDLIRHFFPDSIDHLSRERGEVGGPRPNICAGIQVETFLLNVFRAGDPASNCIEFGAEQVVIVRNDKDKERVRSLNKNIGLVMTVFEAKGMEFSDVLLYNFFKNSPADLKWRVILSCLEGYDKGIKAFSHEKHYILSSELKNLYVALTRARQSLWIFDENSECSWPILRYWEHHGLVNVVNNIEEITALPTLAKKSDSQEWDRQGKTFFERHQYELSGNEDRQKLAHAYHLQQLARISVNDSDEATIKSNFVQAARAFSECSRPKQEASCYQDVGMHEEAGDVYVKWEMFELAAGCYTKAKNWRKTGDCFAKAKMYDEAVVAYKDGRLYKIAIDFMERHKGDVTEKIFRRVIRLIYINCMNNDKEVSKKALSMLPTAEDQIEILRDHAPEEVPEVYKKSGQFRDAAKDLCLRGKFEEASNVLLNHSVEDEDIIESLQCILHLCRSRMLKNIIEGNVSLNTKEELQRFLSKANDITTTAKSQSVRKSIKWKILMEEFQLYLSYLHDDLDAFCKGIKFFQKQEESAIEFRAVYLWLLISARSDINADYWSERLQFLLRLCELAFPFIAPLRNAKNIDKVRENFEDIFLIKKVEDRPNKRQISSDNPLISFINDVNSTETVMDYWHIHDVNVVYRLQKYVNMKSARLKIAEGITRLLSVEQINECFSQQRFWAERLVGIHFRYQSPHTSCPDVTHMVINELPDHAYNGLIDLSYKKWLGDEFNVKDFAIMLKFIFVSMQLQNTWGIENFNWKISEYRLSRFNTLLLGYEFNYGSYKAVGGRLSLFLLSLKSNDVIAAVMHAKKFIRYAVDNLHDVNLDSSDSLGDLVSLMEFTTCLIFSARLGYFDFILPRSYLINYFYVFNAEPLLPGQHYSDKYKYLGEIKGSFHQIRILLDILVRSQYYHSAVILRLIRLLILVGLNQSELARSMILNLLGDLSTKFYNAEFKKYLEKNSMASLVEILNNDIKKTGCDSLLMVYYDSGAKSRFFEWEKKIGITKLSYNSIEVFRSSLKDIMTSEDTEESAGVVTIDKQLSSRLSEGSEQNLSTMDITFIDDGADGGTDYNEADEISEEAHEPTTEIQSWFHQIHESPQAQEAARKIQYWFHKIQNREKDAIYDDVLKFCQFMLREKGKSAVYKYNIRLRVPMVDMIVKLIRLQERMDKIKVRLDKSVKKFDSDSDEYEICLDLREELRNTHYENVKTALNSLSVTENLERHKEANIEWLEAELEKADGIIEQVHKWINRCSEVIKL